MSARIIGLCDIERLRRIFVYHQDTGALEWNVSRGSIKKGAPAASKNSGGYLDVRIDGNLIKVHRVAWAIVYGYWPSHEIDHINGIRTDNRLCNLRKASKYENMQNQKIRKSSKSGYKGVSFYSRKKMWRACITVNKKFVHIGFFEKPEQAHAAYVDSAKKYFGEFARGV